MSSIIAKIIEEGNKLNPVMRRLTIWSLCASFATWALKMDDPINNILARLDTVLILSVVQTCVGTATIAIALGAVLFAVSFLVYVFTEDAKGGDDAGQKRISANKTQWIKVSRGAELFMLQLQSSLVFAMHFLLLGASVLWVMRNSFRETMILLIPDDGWRMYILIINGLCLLIWVTGILVDKLNLIEDKENMRPLDSE